MTTEDTGINDRVFEVLPQPALLLDTSDRIVAANAAWRNNIALACGCAPRCGVGTAYRDTCEFKALTDRAASRLAEALANPGQPGSSRTVQSEVADLHVQTLTESQTLLLWANHPDDKPGIDPLTGVMDRGQFNRHLQAALDDPGRLSVAFLDLDGFKVINDTFGHAEGDRVLAGAAGAIHDAVAHHGRVARLGGDEFAIISDLSEADLRELTLSAIEHIRHTSRTAGLTLPLSASAGVVEAAAGDTPDLLLRNADTAAYQAKRRGRGRVEVFDQSLRAATVQTHRLMVELERAFGAGELTAWYQPVVSLSDGVMRGAEALVRWDHPDQGWLEPAAFLPAIRQGGLLSELGLHMLRTVMLQQVRWRDAHPADRIALGVNLSTGEIAQPHLLDTCAKLFRTTGADPEWFVIEVLEEALAEDGLVVQGAFDRLRQMGIHLTIDDFGEGHSSLRRLADLPVHGLKIDGSFIAGLPQDENSRAIVEATIGLGTRLGLRVMAEGVETLAQHHWLLEHDCTMGQGFLYGPPMPAAELETELAAGVVGYVQRRLDGVGQEPSSSDKTSA